MSLDIHQGFSRKSFFLTGGSGFMGKVLLFKLLKEFPDLDAIYILMRGKNSRRLKRYLGPQERLEKEVLGSPCFDPLREALGAEGFKARSSRLIGVEGNIHDDRLGLNDKDCQRILTSVNYIVHMAATVNLMIASLLLWTQTLWVPCVFLRLPRNVESWRPWFTFLRAM
ncbi:hypothetical protein C4B63_340g14 [Trypanosoma cruzi]|uniref:Fatty acyl-CoA reductase n=1 Tax=Trypanosoma cruzi TaxID=5693 RepID=A0A2V2UII1_TRYCR|nr:hypothetical protein C4B63_340g14 [Trypanosoma cruzi]